MAGPAPLSFIPYPEWLGKLLGELFKPPAWGSGGTGAPGSLTNPLTTAQAEALFKEMAAQPQIPFNWPRDGCFARAHEMRRLMAEKGIESGKYWNYASPGGALVVPGTGIGTVTWGWHVAPSVMVQGPGGAQPMVIDPSLFSQAVSPEAWAGKQGDTKVILMHTDSALYQPTKDRSGWIRDDDYARTRQDLALARYQRWSWDNGIDPRTGAPRPRRPA